jgi:cell wall-associated NlpC family hydrolase
MKLDTRMNAYRDDLADEKLRGQVTSAQFVKGVLTQAIQPVADVHRSPASDSSRVTQMLLGETAFMFEDKNGWAWVQLKEDRYTGYVKREALTPEVTAPTHTVANITTIAFPRADLKSLPVAFLPMNAQVSVVGSDGNYAALSSGQFVFAEHLKSHETHARDFVSVAEMYVGVPYLWGGKTSLGLDCSGLVQTALRACGITCPRDADMQEDAFSQDVHLEDIQRGDLVFWDGHVGIMSDSTTLLHANGHHMKTVLEPLQSAVARISGKGFPVTSVKRVQ